MHALGIVTGPTVEPDTVLEPLLDELEDRGRVGVVREGEMAPERTVYEIGDEGWSAQGPGLDAEDALSTLAETHDVALIVGFPEADVPQMAVGEAELDEPAVAFPDPAAVEPATAIEAMEAGEPIETLESLVATVKASSKAELSGAIATFTGQVRAKETPNDEPTESLTFEKYDEVAAERMVEIEEELTDWDGVHEVEMHHKVGRIERGKDIVFVVVLAGHRGQAFEAVEAGINRLKEAVPIFKKETTVESEFWRHEREP